MVIYIGADHRGFELKGKIKDFLKSRGYTVVDLGDDRYDENDDFPVFAAKVAGQISVEFETAKGILICGSGAGVSVAANKFPRIRAAFAGTPDQAYDSRHEDDTNILSLGANYLDEEAAKKIVLTWLETPFSGEERYRKRLDEISQLEQKIFGNENGGAPGTRAKIDW